MSSSFDRRIASFFRLGMFLGVASASAGIAAFSLLGAVPGETVHIILVLTGLVIVLSFGLIIGLWLGQRMAQRLLHQADTLRLTRAAEDHYRSLIELSPFAVWIEVDGRFRMANRATRQLFDVQPDEALIGAAVNENFEPGDAELIRWRMRQTARQEGPLPAQDYRITRPDGSTRHVEVVSVRLGMGTGQTLVMAQDVTKKKQSEDDLSAREEQLRLAFEGGRLGCWNWDDRTRQLSWADEVTLSLGIPPRVFHDLLEPFLRDALEDDKPALIEALRALRDAGTPLNHEYRARLEDHDERWINVVGKAEMLHGVPTRLAGIIKDVTRSKRAELNLERLTAQLRDLGHRLQQAREEERQRISREVHDELGQSLTAMRMELAFCKQRLQRPGPHPEDFVPAKLDVLTGLVDETIHIVRRIASELRPGLLDQLGPAAAIEWLANDFQTRHSIPCDIDIEDSPARGEQATTLFRVCQESLTNIVRHSQATRVTIRLDHPNQHCRLIIRDNGIGFTPTSTRPGALGLVGIRERAGLVGGEVNVSSQPGEGTTLELIVPLGDRGPG